jgi:hypothetical protein
MRSQFVVALLTGLALSPLQARADVVVTWNQIALDATVTANQGPLPQIRSMAIVHLAVHDAVNGITGDYETYRPVGDVPHDAAPEAAAIAAAHRVLVTLFGAQSTNLNGWRAASLAAEGLTEDDPGIDVGENAAAAILAIAAADKSNMASFPYTAPGAGNPGVWVPVDARPAASPGWGYVVPWVLRSGSQFRPEGPPALDSARYTRDYLEVWALGGRTGSARSQLQSDVARFWLAAPAVLWNQVLRQILAVRGQDLSASARTVALFYLAASDAGIACWDAKYTYNFWRPYTAIRQADTDDNPQTIADPAWEIFLTHGQHPEYPSGHTTNSGAMVAVLNLLFGDDPGVPLNVTSPTNAGLERTWATPSEGLDEVVEARIWSGFHFRTADEVGVRLGRQVAQFVFRHALRERRGAGPTIP